MNTEDRFQQLFEPIVRICRITVIYSHVIHISGAALSLLRFVLLVKSQHCKYIIINIYSKVMAWRPVAVLLSDMNVQ